MTNPTEQGHDSMSEKQWKAFIDHLWLMVAFWSLMKGYKRSESKQLKGGYFYLSMIATRDQFFMTIAHTFHLCAEIVKQYDVGDDAKARFAELQEIFTQRDTQDRSVLTFDDCGIKAFRDKVLAHPSDHIKALHGKEPLKISLKWETVEKTVKQINEFADCVEMHYGWTQTHKEGILGLDDDFLGVVFAMRDSEKYDVLMRNIMLKGGKASVAVDWMQHELAIVDE